MAQGRGGSQFPRHRSLGAHPRRGLPALRTDPESRRPTLVPQPSATQAAPPTDVPTAAATDSPTAPAVVTFAAQPVAPTATATPDLLHLHSVSPRTVVQGSGATITSLGPTWTLMRRSPSATTTSPMPINCPRPAVFVAAGGISREVRRAGGKPGWHDRRAAQGARGGPEADDLRRTGSRRIGPGHSLELTVDSIPGASLRAVVRTANGHPAPHIVASLHQQSPGEWRVTLAVGTHVPLGSYVAVFTAASGSQRATISLRFQVSDMVGASL